MQLIAFLVLFPLLVAALLLLVRADWPRNVIVGVSAVAIAVASIALAVQYLSGGWIGFEFSSHVVDYIGCGISVVLGIAHDLAL